MATTTKTGVGEYRVDGQYDIIFVNMTVDERGVLYHAVNINECFLGSFGDLQSALEWAEGEADSGSSEDHDTDEVGDGMSDAEADANALASAGWGSDEDY